jgi:N-acetyl sugar amidotransferase
MNRCTRCIYPDTRPDSHFDSDGVCSGCRSFDERASIDWAARAAHIEALIAAAKKRQAPYDVVVPVSGGKDSTYQVLRMVELGAKVLAVNGATDMLSAIGRRNLDNLKRFCDVIEWTPNIEARKKLVRIGLFRVGDMSYPEHLSIWSLPTRIAVKFGIPLIVWGEQPQREYATPDGIIPATTLDSSWVAQFGGLCGLRVSDLVGEEGLSERDLEVFRFPSDSELDSAGVQGIWLGDYELWDGWKNGFIAQQHGFEVMPHPVETSLANYENVDNHVTIPRDFLRYLKFGYTRGTDIACNHVRRGRLTRNEALRLEQKTVGFPWTSLGKPIEEVLAYFGLTLQQYIDECRRWMNPDIFSGFGDNFHPVLRKPNGAGHAHHPGTAQQGRQSHQGTAVQS